MQSESARCSIRAELLLRGGARCSAHPPACPSELCPAAHCPAWEMHFRRQARKTAIPGVEGARACGEALGEADGEAVPPGEAAPPRAEDGLGGGARGAGPRPLLSSQ